MEDNDCVMKYIEIVPLDNFNNCSDVTDIKQEPLSVKVSTACHFFFTYFTCLCAGSVGTGIFFCPFLYNVNAVIFVTLFASVLQSVPVTHRL